MSNIYLVGYRGSGKSRVAPLVAQFLGWPWLDCDDLLEQQAGLTIAELFAQEGEHGFRDREAAVLTRIAQTSGQVVATGGGVIERAENRRCLRHGFVVWLTADAEVLHQRLAMDPSTAARRPALTTRGGGIDEIRAVLARRTPLYREVADLELPTDLHSAEDLAQKVAFAWRGYLSASSMDAAHSSSTNLPCS